VGAFFLRKKALFLCRPARYNARRAENPTRGTNVVTTEESLMVCSMTGYGKGEAKAGRSTVTVEIRTVNHRFIEFSIRCPRSLSDREREIERLARRKLKRGHVYISVTVGGPGGAESPVVNRKLLVRTYRDLSKLAAAEHISGSIDINTMLSLPEMFTGESERIAPRILWKSVKHAFGIALDRCVTMRATEGRALARDVMKRIATIERLAGRIERRAPGALERSLERSRKKIESLVKGTEIDESRWAIEAAILADRTDFSEELVRLQSHLAQFRSVIERGGEVAKTLTFLMQEIHREATTMGTKAADSVVIRDCLAVKEAVEKIREQVQNLE
jgi:uncharacterized protein (TIGR00255 family)